VTNFEGNAQGFKLLNKKEYQGLKLTYATLLAFSKYPRESLLSHADPTRKSQKKYGFFQSEKQIFKQLAEDVGLISLQKSSLAWCRHPLTFLVEAADDICYNIIDLEDGCRLGLVTFQETKELLVKIIGKRFNPDKLEIIRSRDEKLGVLRAMAIGALINESVNVFMEHEINMLSGTFDKALTDCIPSKEALEEISEISVSRIYRSRTVLESEVAGFEVLQGLLHSFITASYNHKILGKNKCSARDKSILRLLPEEYQNDEHFKEGDEYDIIMNIIDFIASLTDKYAISLYRNIRGFSLS
jgi:dGTPase